MTHFIGVLEGGEDVWSVWFPDVIGCVGAGPTPEDAVQDAMSALSVIAELTLADGDALPKPRNQLQLLKEPWVAEAVAKGDAFVRIPLIVNSGRSVRANISLDNGLLEAIDDAARQRGLTRSAFIASTMRDKILAEV
jgi:predicted RNase H-like HicB family nuclease